MGNELSDGTIQRVNALFQHPDRGEVLTLLLTRCGENLPLYRENPPQNFERIRFAVLKLSSGDLSELRRAVEIANVDWRDVLVAAGFGNSLTAHLSWWPSEQSGP